MDKHKNNRKLQEKKGRRLTLGLLKCSVVLRPIRPSIPMTNWLVPKAPKQMPPLFFFFLYALGFFRSVCPEVLFFPPFFVNYIFLRLFSSGRNKETHNKNKVRSVKFPLNDLLSRGRGQKRGRGNREASIIKTRMRRTEKRKIKGRVDGSVGQWPRLISYSVDIGIGILAWTLPLVSTFFLPC